MIEILSPLCPVAAVLCLSWIFVSDRNRMVVPIAPLALLAVSGIIWRAAYGWDEFTVSLILIVPFLYLYVKKGMGEGDVLLMAVLTLWFHPEPYLLVIASGFAFGTAWGLVKIARAGELRNWTRRLANGVFEEIPETSAEATVRPDCVPMAAALAITAVAGLILTTI